jgi:phosphatidylinositol glycan class B
MIVWLRLSPESRAVSLKIKMFNWSRLRLTGIIIFAITAWFSAGYFHPDEQFQLLELTNWKLGATPAGDLSWEFGAHIRPALQPTVAFCIIQGMNGLGLSDPFIQAFVLRLLSGLLALFVFYKLSNLLVADFTFPNTVFGLFAACLFLWFMPFLSVRFSSENWSAWAFLAALFLILKHHAQPVLAPRVLLGAGLLLGLSFFFRFQIAFAIIGLGVWLWIIRKLPVINWLWLFAGGLTGLAIGFLVDRWFYGAWVCTPWAYFNHNMLQGILHDKVAMFGLQPWWFYFTESILKGIPPLSLVLLGAIIWGWYRQRAHVLTWVFTSFLLAHIAIGHKELRFLFPMLFPVLFLAASGLEPWYARWRKQRAIRISGYTILIINGLLWIYSCTQPQGLYIPYYKYLYAEANKKPVQLWVEKEDPYRLVGLQSNFYKPANIQLKVVDDFNSLQNTPAPTDTTRLLLHRRLRFEAPQGLQVERVYSYLPDWLMQYDFNQWQERSAVWSIYRF